MSRQSILVGFFIICFIMLYIFVKSRSPIVYRIQNLTQLQDLADVLANNHEKEVCIGGTNYRFNLRYSKVLLLQDDYYVYERSAVILYDNGNDVIFVSEGDYFVVEGYNCGLAADIEFFLVDQKNVLKFRGVSDFLK